MALNLASQDAFDTYDIQLTYNSTVLKFQNETAASGSDEFIRCIQGAGAGCTISDGPDIIHSAATFSYGIYGPINSFTLFTVQFSVIGKGVSVFHPFNDTVYNFGIPVLHQTQDGIFSNRGVVAFFNVAPAILIVNQPVSFDGSASFNPNGTLIKSYSWSFGDGAVSGQGPLVPHNYTSPGRYSVTLTVTDQNGSTGTLTKTIPVVSGLGAIRVTMLSSAGQDVPNAVTVSLYNGTLFVQNYTKPAFVVGALVLSNLKPGTYRLIFSGPGVVSNSIALDVIAGWTTWYTATLTLIKPPPAGGGSDIRFFLALGAVGGGALLGALTIFRSFRRKKRKAKC